MKFLGKVKITQVIMIWFLPFIVIGGLFFPILGYLVLAMMAVFLPLSFFKGRYWCWNLCPRGSFLDIILSKFSLNRHLPKIFAKEGFRWLIFVLFISFLIFRLMNSGGNIIVIGAIFVSMCMITTLISIILGVSIKHRSWCVICPMGTLQEKIGRSRR